MAGQTQGIGKRNLPSSLLVMLEQLACMERLALAGLSLLAWFTFPSILKFSIFFPQSLLKHSPTGVFHSLSRSSYAFKCLFLFNETLFHRCVTLATSSASCFIAFWLRFACRDHYCHPPCHRCKLLHTHTYPPHKWPACKHSESFFSAPHSWFHCKNNGQIDISVSNFSRLWLFLWLLGRTQLYNKEQAFLLFFRLKPCIKDLNRTKTEPILHAGLLQTDNAQFVKSYWIYRSYHSSPQ